MTIIQVLGSIPGWVPFFLFSGCTLSESLSFQCKTEDAWAYIFLMNNTMTGTVYTDCNKRKKEVYRRHCLLRARESQATRIPSEVVSWHSDRFRWGSTIM